MTPSPAPVRPLDEDALYPYEDGKPLAESDFLLRPLVYVIDALRSHFHDRPDVYVAGDMFLYYEQGNPRAVVAPDVFVVVGAPKHDRLSYLLWREPKAPDFVLEVTSQSTRAEDTGIKRDVYAHLGISEYWLFDPTRDYLDPPLRGLRLDGGEYVPLPEGCDAQGRPVLHSAVLGLDLRVEGGELRLCHPDSGECFLSYDEAVRGRAEAQARIAELEAELRRLREGGGGEGG